MANSRQKARCFPFANAAAADDDGDDDGCCCCCYYWVVCCAALWSEPVRIQLSEEGLCYFQFGSLSRTLSLSPCGVFCVLSGQMDERLDACLPACLYEVQRSPKPQEYLKGRAFVFVSCVLVVVATAALNSTSIQLNRDMRIVSFVCASKMGLDTIQRYKFPHHNLFFIWVFNFYFVFALISLHFFTHTRKTN